jgi:hypothetical protein
MKEVVAPDTKKRPVKYVNYVICLFYRFRKDSVYSHLHTSVCVNNIVLHDKSVRRLH